MSLGQPQRGGHQGLRNLARYVLSFLFDSLFVSGVFVYGPSLSKTKVLGIFTFQNFNWGSFGIFWQYVIIVFLMAFGMLLASLITLTLPHTVYFLLDVVFGSLIIVIVVSVIPYFAPHLVLMTPATFGVFWIAVISPTLLIVEFLLYAVSRPYQRRVVSYVH